MARTATTARRVDTSKKLAEPRSPIPESVPNSTAIRTRAKITAAEAAVAEKAKAAVDAAMAVAEKEAEKITINVILEPDLEKKTSLAATDAVQPNTRFVTATLLLHLTEAEIEVKIATVIETEIVTKIEIEIEIATRELRRPHGMLKQTMSPHRKNRKEIVAAMTVDTMAVEEAAR